MGLQVGLQETCLRPKDIYRLKVREWKNIFHANGKRKKVGVAILISDKVDLSIRDITRVKEGHYIIIKGSIQEEDIIIVISMQPTLELVVVGLFLISDQTKPGFISLIVHDLCSWLFCQNLSLLWMLLNFVKYLKTIQKCILTLISFKRRVK